MALQGIEKYCKVSGGYTTISNVRNPLDTRPKDMMESFFLGETLKYFGSPFLSPFSGSTFAQTPLDGRKR